MPDRLTSPTVGFTPTMPQMEDGETIEPSVSVPTATTHKFADTATAGANDQINCVLRAVGTFPGTGMVGTAPTGVTIKEARANMTTLAQGATGFNPPGLVGMATGAPYFHAGNARSLEELFSDTFTAHYQAHSVNFLTGSDRAVQTRQIIAFIQSIDDSTTTLPTRGDLTYNPELCPTSL